ncbi:glycosyl hydrolase 53 family protein [uncultured Bacteroides sp.]|uniref:glycoside hydrolase family 53 protein n=1 Tax=uncultured Bacteroides sp. TaxID=162156 RepID=UPI00263637C4|nr:glycosyl hydrolase 53 family protein [uncultured Bacteroides sp.]
MKLNKLFLAAAVCFGSFSFACCSSSDDSPSTPEKPDQPDTPTYDMNGFPKGADVSWITEMEKAGKTWKDASGKNIELLPFLRDAGMNSIRLRVWVNPTYGWCNKADVVAKAQRASDLGFRLMIDFHYSDTWADPGNQTKPAAWAGYSFAELKQAVTDHTKDVLSALKAKNIDVEWVQVGNETRNGMLYPDGQADKNPKQFAELVTAGYDAVKTVYPKAKVIVHNDRGNIYENFQWLFDILKNNGGKWDLIGMSLYPDTYYGDDWKQMTDDCMTNIRNLKAKYNTNCIICEFGISWDDKDAAEFVSYLVQKAKANTSCEGVFYWEPECYGGWNGYTKGMFDNNGCATPTFNAFANIINE